jgi:hypothetical protein
VGRRLRIGPWACRAIGAARRAFDEASRERRVNVNVRGLSKLPLVVG